MKKQKAWALREKRKYLGNEGVAAYSGLPNGLGHLGLTGGRHRNLGLHLRWKGASTGNCARGLNVNKNRPLLNNTPNPGRHGLLKKGLDRSGLTETPELGQGPPRTANSRSHFDLRVTRYASSPASPSTRALRINGLGAVSQKTRDLTKVNSMGTLRIAHHGDWAFKPPRYPL
ncbi:hypothetical protein Nepgr_029245 [Nepenthes gracilis]|uniref:Uncharacterized protein n=1 Tax=Nepenthes gracilis TaxID=150966 RepID=A0AAD3Y2U4_NEPGR|nr:hypothetical protein Nepgr_029245 [Nepenthes gracilis]